MTLRWGIPDDSTGPDVAVLMQYLESKGRDFHVNTGVHGRVKEGKFEFYWLGDEERMLREDSQNAAAVKTKVSLQMVTKREGPCYHAGVDTIDAFCYGWHRKLTEEELDRVCADFLAKEGQVQQDEKY